MNKNDILIYDSIDQDEYFYVWSIHYKDIENIFLLYNFRNKIENDFIEYQVSDEIFSFL